MADMGSGKWSVLLLCVVIAACVFPVWTKSVEEQRNKRSDDPQPLQVVVDNLVKEMNSMKAQLAAEQTARTAFETKLNTVVAFHASSTSAPITATPHGTVIVPHVNTNIGHAYDPQTGFFTAPVSGLYMFHATFMGDSHASQTNAGIYVGGSRLVSSVSDSDHGEWDNPGLAAIAHVTAGQKVQLRSLNDGVDTFHGYQYTTFSGFLIRAD